MDSQPSGQSYQEWRPVPELADLVSSVWVQEVSPGAAPYPHRNVPNGCVEFRCLLGGPLRVMGPQTGPVTETLAPGSTVAGLRFRPGAAAGLLGIPVSDIAGQVLDTADLWGRAAVAVGQRLAEAADPGRAAAALQEAVAARLAGADGPDRLVAQAVRWLAAGRAGGIGLARTALWISEREFRRRCLAAVGEPPKALQRVLRFQGFLANVQVALARGVNPAAAGLARAAADCGYADQAHLGRECLRLAGVTPLVFLRQTEQSCGSAGHDHSVSCAPLQPYTSG